MKFKELNIGDRFEFDRDGLPIVHGLATGPWEKTGARTYKHVTDAHLSRCLVGTTNVTVKREAQA